MKKKIKIKDLTLEECEKICDKNICYRRCPLFICLDEDSQVWCIKELFETHLESEVEVNE